MKNIILIQRPPSPHIYYTTLHMQHQHFLSDVFSAACPFVCMKAGNDQRNISQQLNKAACGFILYNFFKRQMQSFLMLFLPSFPIFTNQQHDDSLFAFFLYVQRTFLCKKNLCTLHCNSE